MAKFTEFSKMTAMFIALAVVLGLHALATKVIEYSTKYAIKLWLKAKRPTD